MALYVSVKRALKFPAVINAIPKPSVLWKRVKAGVTGVRLAPAGAATSRLAGQIDVTAITGVSALKKNGKK